jgi:16S rRNA (uracil1498-N3)-methyltransferase
MTTPRFLVPAGLAAGQVLALPAAAQHHARRVLRLRAGDAVVLFDGAGNEFEALLADAGRNDSRLLAQVGPGGPRDREAGVSITLVQALCAQDKLDWLVEKCVELGAARLILAPAARSVVRLEGARRERRLERWRELAAAACCQCGRNRLPVLELADDLGAALRAAPTDGQRWVLDPRGGAGLRAGAGPVTFAVGPEGGYTEAEIGLAQSLGYAALRLGPRVLRTETAGLAAISATLALRGELA